MTVRDGDTGDAMKNADNGPVFGHIVFLCLISGFGAAETPFLADWAAADAEVAAVYADMGEHAPVYMPCPFRYKQALGLIPFDPDGFPDLTNRVPAHLVLDWLVYGLTVTETQQVSRVWLYHGDNRDAVHTNAVPSGFDPQAWVRSAYGTPPSWITGTNLTRWYSDRDRSRVLLRIDLVPSNTYEALSEALIAARTNAIPQPTGPVMPADSNRLSFAGIEAAGGIGAPGLWIYTPVDGLAVDLFSRGSLTDGQRWTHRGVLNAAAPFAPWDPGTNALAMEFYAAARADIDSDSDGIPDGREMLSNGTNPNAADTDADGLGDFTEIFRYGTSPLLVDTDGDGLTDYEEYLLGANPLTDDMDGDGLTDMTEVCETFTPFNDRDADNDGLTDFEEVVLYHTSPFNPDTEFDGVDDYDEISLCTSPLLADTDGDGICDYTELYYDQYLSPTNAADAAGDIDNDGFSNLIEYQNFWSMTSPTNGNESARFLMICVNPGSNSILFKTGGLTGTYSFFALGDAGDASSILRIPPTKEVGGTMVKRLYHSGSPYVRLDGTPLSELASPILVPDTSGTVDYRVTAFPSNQGATATFWMGNDQGTTNTLTCRIPKVTSAEFRDRNGTRYVDVSYGATGTLVLAWSPDPHHPAGIHVTPTISPTYYSGVPLLDRRDYPLARVTGAVTNFTASLNYYRYDSAYRFRRGLILPVGKHLVAVGLDWNLDGQLQDDEVSMMCEVYIQKVDIVLTNQYPDIPISPVYGATPGKKWVIATFPEPDQINVKWDVQLLGMANADAAIRYQRGTSAEADVGWLGTPGDVYFTNGWLNASVRLNDGSNSIPKMSLASNILTISSVQQGDRIIVEEPNTSCRDQIAVVKNFSWNDLQRLGVGNLEMDPKCGSLNGPIKDAIVDTVVFCLDPRTSRDQKPQLTNDCFPNSGLSTIIYTNFHSAHTNLLQLDIPSSRSIGMYPWDYDHWHMGLEVEPIPSAITNKQAILEDAADAPWVSFPVFQSNTVSKLVDLLNTAYADTNVSFLISHTYEGGEGSASKYVDPAGVKTLKPGDPIRNIRWEFTTNNYPRLSYPGHEDDAEWGHGAAPPAKVWQVEMFINRSGKVVLIGSVSGLEVTSGMISDALREE